MEIRVMVIIDTWALGLGPWNQFNYQKLETAFNKEAWDES